MVLYDYNSNMLFYFNNLMPRDLNKNMPCNYNNFLQGRLVLRDGTSSQWRPGQPRPIPRFPTYPKHPRGSQGGHSQSTLAKYHYYNTSK